MKFLKKIIVIDLSRVLAGPLCAQNLGDLGAKVIKVEEIESGDDIRKWGPPFVKKESSDDSAYYTYCNRNKKSIGIDFSRKKGRNILHKLIKKADILIENFPTGKLKRYKLDYSSIKKINNKIIYCSITGFGQTGPYKNKKGYDFVIQGMSGLMSTTGNKKNKSQNDPIPLKSGIPVSDLFTSNIATSSILAALYSRKRTKKSYHLDCSLLDCQISMLANHATNWLIGKKNPKIIGNSHSNVTPYDVYDVKDGKIIIACGNEKQFFSLLKAINKTEIINDERYNSNEKRLSNRLSFNLVLEKNLKKFSKQEILKKLDKFDVPCGPINNIQEIIESNHVKKRMLKTSLNRSDNLNIEVIKYPIKFNKKSLDKYSSPPLHCENTTAILLKYLKLKEEEIEKLKIEKIIK